jgi:pectin methylesterase-like acyl-CoA thioesterase
MNRAAIAVALLLTTASAARAEDFLVPTAEYPTIQSAIDAASAAPGSNEVKVHLGTYVERLHIDSLAGDFLLISGGWEDGWAHSRGAALHDAGGVGYFVP